MLWLMPLITHRSQSRSLRSGLTRKRQVFFVTALKINPEQDRIHSNDMRSDGRFE